MLCGDFGMTVGVRTKLINQLISRACIQLGSSQDDADQCGKYIEQIFIKDEEKSKESKAENDTLLFLSPKEVSIISRALEESHLSHPKP